MHVRRGGWYYAGMGRLLFRAGPSMIRGLLLLDQAGVFPSRYALAKEVAKARGTSRQAGDEAVGVLFREGLAGRFPDGRVGLTREGKGFVAKRRAWWAKRDPELLRPAPIPYRATVARPSAQPPFRMSLPASPAKPKTLTIRSVFCPQCNAERPMVIVPGTRRGQCSACGAVAAF